MLRLFQDYLELTKPKVVLLMLLTTWVGMLLAAPPDNPPWKLMFLSTIGIAFCAGAAAIFNHLIDRKIDTLMKRTHNRPIAKGRISVTKALSFSLVLALLGLFILAFYVNPLTAVLTAGTVLGYAIVYTIFLKHTTPQNIVIGGLAGATPPLLGWTAITNDLHAHALLLVLIIFAWTPPHFWALAIYKHHEYAKAKVPMLPVTHGIPFTKLNITLYTILLMSCTVLPFLAGFMGWIYLISCSLLGCVFLGFVLVLYKSSDPKIALQTFLYSIFYLMALFISLLLDHYCVYFIKSTL
ncbi:MAG TPA: heme o synthase [Gammaproteobacteria bacterium]|nr:heme o synthase [Gammaproteobacteria bacterium]